MGPGNHGKYLNFSLAFSWTGKSLKRPGNLSLEKGKNPVSFSLGDVSPCRTCLLRAYRRLVLFDDKDERKLQGKE